MQAFDLLVVGGGSGGLAMAQRAVEYGARVALFEPNRLGGTCVNVGCVPKKVMWNAAELAAALEHAPHYGFDVTVGRHDWAKLKQARDAYVARLNGIYQRNLDKKSITTIRAAAQLTSLTEVVDSEGRTYTAKHIVIATGGEPGVPTLIGAELGDTSDDFFEWPERPSRLAVVGSGYIAVELAGVLRTLGSDVVLVLRRERLLRQFDAVLGDKLIDAMRASGIDVLTEFMPSAVERDAGRFALKSADGRRVTGCDRVLWAVGRTPRTQGLNLAAAGVAIDDDGYITVDKYQNTNVSGIYAIGDVTGQAELTPVAIAAGRRLADRVFGGQKDRHLSYDMVPTVVFSHPPIGTVGLSEAAARERYPNEPVRVYQADFVSMFYALTEVKPRTWMKLVAVGADERIVGCHVIGQAADEIIQGFAVALTMGARKRDFDDTIAIHPTSAEELVTMR
ncbi:MAG: glutathione-disulfide reductase [Gammaproteobacteria bacterium]